MGGVNFRGPQRGPSILLTSASVLRLSVPRGIYIFFTTCKSKAYELSEKESSEIEKEAKISLPINKVYCGHEGGPVLPQRSSKAAGSAEEVMVPSKEERLFGQEYSGSCVLLDPQTHRERCFGR